MPRLNLIYNSSRRTVSAGIDCSRSEPAVKPGELNNGMNVPGGSLRLRSAEERKLQESEALAELEKLIGLVQVKNLVREIFAYIEVGHWRAREKLSSDNAVFHMVFKGNPGTGKTTVARLIGRLFRELGVLSKGHLLEVERADLVGEYIGHTAQRTRDHVKKALGGILFIDEAYSLARGGERDFGREAIDTLVRAMEQHRNEFILVLAGYRKEMEWFLRTNPGLRSRLPLQLDFPDYTPKELLDIARYFLSQRDYFLSPEAALYLEEYLKKLVGEGGSSQGNARLVRNLLEKGMRHQAVRLLQRGNATREDLMRLELRDFKEDEKKTGSDPALNLAFQTEEPTHLEA